MLSLPQLTIPSGNPMFQVSDELVHIDFKISIPFSTAICAYQGAQGHIPWVST